MTAQSQRDKLRSERRAQMIDAAVRLLDRDRREGVSMRNLAQETGLSPMAAYQYFESQQALMLAVWEFVMRDLTRSGIDAALPSLEDPAVGYLASFRAVLEYARAWPSRFELLFNDPIVHVVREHGQYDALRSELYLFTRELMVRARSQGVFRSDMSVEDLQLIATALMYGLGNNIVMQRDTRFFNTTAEASIATGMGFLRESIMAR